MIDFSKFDSAHENIALKIISQFSFLKKKKHMKPENLTQPRHEELCETASKNIKIKVTPHLHYKDSE